MSDRSVPIEAPTDGVAKRSEALQLELLDRIPSGGAALLHEAGQLLRKVPSLNEAIAALVRSIHLLRAPGEGYDVSHSDPELPFSIFVSLAPDERHAELRLAESIVHEAMHLQLTLAEQRWPLVQETAVKLYSPWMREDRPIGGLLHGLYVFTVIGAFLQAVRPTVDRNGQAYIQRRLDEIDKECAHTATLQGDAGLTAAGQALASALHASLGELRSRGSTASLH